MVSVVSLLSLLVEQVAQEPLYLEQSLEETEEMEEVHLPVQLVMLEEEELVDIQLLVVMASLMAPLLARQITLVKLHLHQVVEVLAEQYLEQLEVEAEEQVFFLVLQEVQQVQQVLEEQLVVWQVLVVLQPVPCQSSCCEGPG